MFPGNVQGVGQALAGLSSFDDAGHASPDVLEQPQSQQPPQAQPSGAPLDPTAQEPKATGAPEPQPEVKMVPQKDLDALRSKLEKRVSAERQRAEQAEQRYQQTWISQQAEQLYFEALNAGYAEDDRTWQWALQQAQAGLSTNLQQRQTQDYAQQFVQQQTQTARQEYLVSIKNEVLAETKLTDAELLQATRHLNPDSPRFEQDVWKSAAAAALSKAQTTPVAGGAPQQALTPAEQAQALRQSMPMPGGGTNAGGVLRPRPPTGRRSPEHRDWALQVLNEQERR